MAELPLPIMQQAQPVAHIGQRDPMPLQSWAGRHGIGDLDHHPLPSPLAGNAHPRALGTGLHPVPYGIFHQRLQQQGGQQGLLRLRIERPFQLQAIPEAHLLNGQLASRQGNFLGQGHGRLLLPQGVAKQIAQVLQQRFGSGRLRTDQGNGAVERVEQEMRADA